MIQLLNYIKPTPPAPGATGVAAKGKQGLSTIAAESNSASPAGIDFAFCETSLNSYLCLGDDDHWIPRTVKSIDKHVQYMACYNY